VTPRYERIRDEAITYGHEMERMGFAPSQRAAAMYSSGIELGLAIAIAAGPDAPAILAEIREVCYPHPGDQQVIDGVDGVAAGLAVP